MWNIRLILDICVWHKKGSVWVKEKNFGLYNNCHLHNKDGIIIQVKLGYSTRVRSILPQIAKWWYNEYNNILTVKRFMLYIYILLALLHFTMQCELYIHPLSHFQTINNRLLDNNWSFCNISYFGNSSFLCTPFVALSHLTNRRL